MVSAVTLLSACTAEYSLLTVLSVHRAHVLWYNSNFSLCAGDSDSDEEGGEVLGIGGGGDEVIYENFGPDEGNRWMSARELQQYVNSKEKKGLSAEYYKIKNEPLSGPFEAFK